MADKDKRNTALFGSGGNPQNFYDEKHRDTSDIFEWLRERNIDSYEYQAGNGLKAGVSALKKLGEKARENNILLSLHAPYFISITSGDDGIISRSISHALRCIDGAEVMGAYITVIHSGSLSGNSREQSLEKAKQTVGELLNIIYRDGKTRVQIGLETMGKQNQLGTLDEVIELCRLDKIIYPVVDFGHLNARGCGGVFESSDDYLRVFEKIGASLTDDKARELHCHFSKIEYTAKGERKHLTFADKNFGPEFEPLAECIAKNNLYPNIICESDGTMDIDAVYMKNIYNKIKGEYL